MRSNRHVPLIIGIVCICTAAWITFGTSAKWRFLPVALLLLIGWPSLKTAIFASRKEIQELTGSHPMSEETAKRFKGRL